MSGIEHVRSFLWEHGMEDRVQEFDVSSATVALAAQALNCEEARIAKTLSLHAGEQIMVVVMAGDARLDNRKFKDNFVSKPRMLSAEEALAATGYAVGGVCPFALPETVSVYLDESLRRFDVVYPAAGSANSAVQLTPDELQTLTDGIWIDVAKLPQA